MAEFNPQTGQMGTQNYIGYSERRSGNNAWANLFGSVIGAVDANNQSNIESSVNQTVADLDQKFFGMDDIVNEVNGQQTQQQPEDDQVAIPKPVQDGISRISSLNKAAETGSLSQGNYAAQLEANVRALKAKYPGYTGEIDKAVSRAINAPSANMLRDSIIAKRNADANDYEKRITSNYNDIQKYTSAFGPEWEKKIVTRTVTDEEWPQLLAMKGRVEATDMQLARDKANLEITAKKSEINKTEREENERGYEKYATDKVTQLGQYMLYGAGAGDPQGYKKLQDNLTEYSKDGVFSDTEWKSIIPSLKNVEAQMTASYQNMMIKEGLNSKLTPAARENVQKQFDILMDPIRKAIAGNDATALSALKLTASTITVNEDFVKYGISQTPLGQRLIELNQLRELAPVTEKFLNESIASEALKGSQLTQGITSYITKEIVLNGESPSAVVSDLSKKASPAVVGQATREALKIGIEVIKDPSSKPEAKANAFKAMYGAGNLDFLQKLDDKPDTSGRSSRQRAYLAMTSPDVVNAIKGMGDQTTLDAYAEWAKQQVFALNKPAIDSANEVQRWNKYANITYVPGRAQFDVQLDPSKFPNAKAMEDFKSGGVVTGMGRGGPERSMAFGDRLDLMAYNNAKRQVKELNTYLVGLVPILQAQGVKDIDGAIREVVQGLDLNAEKQDRYTYYYNAAIDAAKTAGDYMVPDVVGETIRSGVKAVRGTAQGINQTIQDSTKANDSSIVDPNVGTQPDNAPMNLDESVLPFEGSMNEGPLNIPNKETIAEAEGETLTAMEVAKDYLGMTERSNSKIISAFIKQSAGTDIDPRVTPWCAAFLNAVIGASGGKGTGQLTARSFLNYGTKTDTPSPGDIVVFSRGGNAAAGHVGLYAGEVTKGGERYIKVLGGNQSNSVSIAEYPASTLLGVRKPPKAGTKLTF